MKDYNGFKISLHKSGLFRGCVTVDGRQIDRYGRTEREVTEKLKKLREEAIRGSTIPKKQRLENAMHAYLFDVKQKSVKASSFDRAECTFNNQIRGTALGRKVLDGVKEQDLQRHLNELTQTHSISTTKKVYHLLGDFFRFMVATKQLNHNPMTLVSMPHASQFRKQPKPMSILSPDEMTRVIQAAESVGANGEPVYRYGEAVVLLLLTGLRSGEVRALRDRDIDFSNNMLHVETGISHHKDRVNGGVIDEVSTPKTVRSKRDIPLSPRAVTAIQRLFARTYNADSGLLITTQSGGILSASYFQSQYDSILKRAGIEHKGMHSTRHSCATVLLKHTDAEKKGLIKEVAEILGNTIPVCYDFYIGTSNEDKREMVAVLDDLSKVR